MGELVQLALAPQQLGLLVRDVRAGALPRATSRASVVRCAHST